MICSICNQDKEEKDFINGNDECYKCVYRKKLDAIAHPKKSGCRNCRVCKRICGSSRWVYCSDICAQTGELKQNKDYWIRQVKSL